MMKIIYPIKSTLKYLSRKNNGVPFMQLGEKMSIKDIFIFKAFARLFKILPEM